MTLFTRLGFKLGLRTFSREKHYQGITAAVSSFEISWCMLLLDSMLCNIWKRLRHNFDSSVQLFFPALQDQIKAEKNKILMERTKMKEEIAQKRQQMREELARQRMQAKADKALKKQEQHSKKKERC